jgi:hypothetical protein
MFGRFVSEEIFEKKKKTLYRKRGKTYESKQEKRKINVTCIWEQEF